jgi:hypothetical protein
LEGERVPLALGAKVFGKVGDTSINILGVRTRDYGGTPGYVRAFMPCGQITTRTDAPSITSGITYSYQHTGELPGTGGLQRAVFADLPIYGKANVPLEITVYEKCAINPSLFVEGPQFAICDPGKVIRDPSGILNVEGLVSAQSLGNDTNWHTTRLTFTPTSDRALILRSYAKCMAVTGLAGAKASGSDGAVTSTRIFTPSVAPAWTIDALIGMAVRFESDLTYYIITDNDATTITVAGAPADNANRGPWTIVGVPTSYLWMYNIKTDWRDV